MYHTTTAAVAIMQPHLTTDPAAHTSAMAMAGASLGVTLHWNDLDRGVEAYKHLPPGPAQPHVGVGDLGWILENEIHVSTVDSLVDDLTRRGYLVRDGPLDGSALEYEINIIARHVLNLDKTPVATVCDFDSVLKDLDTGEHYCLRDLLNMSPMILSDNDVNDLPGRCSLVG